MDRKRTNGKEKNMRFKEFTNIDSLRHAKVDEKPVKFFNGDYKELIYHHHQKIVVKRHQQNYKLLKSL